MEGAEVGPEGHLLEAVSFSREPLCLLIRRCLSWLEQPEPIPIFALSPDEGEESAVPDGLLAGRTLARPDVLRLRSHGREPLGQFQTTQTCSLVRRQVKDVLGRIRANEPALPPVPAFPLENIERGSPWQGKGRFDVQPHDDVIPGKCQGRVDATALDPGVLARDAPFAADPGIDDDAGVLGGLGLLGIDEAPAAVDKIPERSEMEETESRHHVDMEGERSQSPIKLAEHVGADRRPGSADVFDVFAGPRVPAEGAADLTIDVESHFFDGVGDRSSPAEGAPSFPAPADAAQLEEADHRLWGEVQDADIEDRLSLGVDRSERRLLCGGGLLQEKPNLSALSPAIDPVVLGQFGADEGPDAGDAFLREHDRRGIEVEKHVARSDDDLPASGPWPGQPEISRDQAVEKRRAEGAPGFSRDGDEDLAARTIRRQPSRIPAGMHDQDPEPAEDARPGLWIEPGFDPSPRVKLQVEDVEKAMDRRTARPDPAAAGIGDN